MESYNVNDVTLASSLRRTGAFAKAFGESNDHFAFKLQNKAMQKSVYNSGSVRKGIQKINELSRLLEP